MNEHSDSPGEYSPQAGETQFNDWDAALAWLTETDELKRREALLHLRLTELLAKYGIQTIVPPGQEEKGLARCSELTRAFVHERESSGVVVSEEEQQREWRRLRSQFIGEYSLMTCLRIVNVDSQPMPSTKKSQFIAEQLLGLGEAVESPWVDVLNEVLLGDAVTRDMIQDDMYAVFQRRAARDGMRRRAMEALEPFAAAHGLSNDQTTSLIMGIFLVVVQRERLDGEEYAAQLQEVADDYNIPAEMIEEIGQSLLVNNTEA